MWRMCRVVILDRRHETVSTTRNRGDVAVAVLTIVQNAPQCRHVHAQIALFDERIRPDYGGQVVLTDHFAGALD
jgi:hypothetical protein